MALSSCTAVMAAQAAQWLLNAAQNANPLGIILMAARLLLQRHGLGEKETYSGIKIEQPSQTFGGNIKDYIEAKMGDRNCRDI